MENNLLNYIGLSGKKVLHNLSSSELINLAIIRNEGRLCENGALVTCTGKYTGRSPKDRFIVNQKSIQDMINWGEVNLPIEEEVFDKLFSKVKNYLGDKELFVVDSYAGADLKYRLPIRVICEQASQALFATNIFIRKNDLESEHIPEFTVISAPGFKAEGVKDGVNSEAFVIINFDRKIVLIGGTSYCGEVKKSIFSIMNMLLPVKGVFPMHCSANIGEKGDTALFFGLSGTGKTTLSTDPNRRLIGDDEHGWSDDGVFNFEGGCYAKTIKLNKEKEKDIYNALKFGSLLENVVLDGRNVPNYDDESLTENTRGTYPIHYISNVELLGKGGHPSVVVFLTADAFGVIPPISRLDKDTAMDLFLLGYTSKVAGTERGIKEPKATFSCCFGEPFMLMKPNVYAELLGKRIDEHKVQVYLLNTGWIAGGYGVGKRIDLPYTRKMVDAIINNKLNNIAWKKHDVFGWEIPTEVEGVPSEILDPVNCWSSKDEYYNKANSLSEKFKEKLKLMK